jgi:Tol biopolymer transport system component
MDRSRSRWALAAAVVLAAALGLAVTLGTDASHAAGPGTIVFASDLDKTNPGEIYSLALGAAPRDISNNLGAESELAIAPVGGLIAFASDRTGKDQLYLARPDGSHVRLVTVAASGIPAGDLGALEGPTVFSSNGSKLFTSYITEQPSTEHEVVVDTKTATARPIGRCLGNAAPSPDGRLVACGSNDTMTVVDLAGHVRFRLPGTYPLWSSSGLLTSMFSVPPKNASAVIDDESGKRLGSARGLAIGWSPDGKVLVLSLADTLRAVDSDAVGRARVLVRGWTGGQVSFTPDDRYVSTDAGGKPVLVPLAGGPATAGLDDGGGAWSRDGRLAYIGAPTGAADAPDATFPVLVTDTHGRHPRVVGRFPHSGAGGSSLGWLPDGRHLLLETMSGCEAKGLFAVPAGGGTARSLSDDPRDLEAPASSPDGTHIAYTVQQRSICQQVLPARTLPLRHIETVLADGSDPQLVTQDAAATPGRSVDDEPAFSPDGTHIAFVHESVAQEGLQTVAVTGGAVTQLVPQGDVSVQSPAWSPDGSTVAYISNGDTIMTVAAGGGTPTVVAPDPAPSSCSAGGLAWSRDGTELAVGGAAGIYLVHLTQPPSAQLVIAAPCAEFPSFSPDGTEIAFDAPSALAFGDQTAIMVANTDGTNLRTLSSFPFRQSVHPTWEPSP